jgi:hypothetical protein
MGAIATLIANTSAGGIADATGLTESAALSLSKALTLLNGTVTAPLVGGFGTPAFQFAADDIDGGGTVIQLNAISGGAGYSNFIARDLVVDRNGHSGGASYMYGNWTNVLFEDCTLINGSNANSAGYAGGRAGTDPPSGPCVGFADGITYRGCWLEADNNSPSLGWEQKCGKNVLAEDCTFRGGPEYFMSMPDSEAVVVDGCDILLRSDGFSRPWAFMEQPGPEAGLYEYRNNIVAGDGTNGTFIYINSLNYTLIDKPIMLVECNVFSAGVDYVVYASDQSGGLQHATIRNNTLASGQVVTSSDGVTGNSFSNNDTDGADHADCLAGASVTPTTASLTLTTFAPTVTATTGQIMRPTTTVSRGDWVLVG